MHVNYCHCNFCGKCRYHISLQYAPSSVSTFFFHFKAKIVGRRRHVVFSKYHFLCVHTKYKTCSKYSLDIVYLKNKKDCKTCKNWHYKIYFSKNEPAINLYGIHVAWWTHNWQIKISTRNKRTASERFSIIGLNPFSNSSKTSKDEITRNSYVRLFNYLLASEVKKTWNNRIPGYITFVTVFTSLIHFFLF